MHSITPAHSERVYKRARLQPPARTERALVAAAAATHLSSDRAKLTELPNDVYASIHALLTPLERALLRRVSRAARQLDGTLTRAVTVEKRVHIATVVNNYPNLRELYVSGHEMLWKNDFVYLKRLQHLAHLHLQLRSVNQIPLAARYVPQITSVDLRASNEALGADELAQLRGLTALTSLGLTIKSGAELRQIAKTLPHATVLSLRLHDPLTFDDARLITKFKQLHTLHIASPLAPDAKLFDELRAGTTLHTLHIEKDVHVSDALLKEIGGLVQLRSLHLGACFSSNTVSKAGFEHLAGLVKLTELRLNFKYDFQPDALFAAVGKLAGLRVLKLPQRITDADLGILKTLPNLQELDISRALGLSGAGIETLRYVPNLRKLDWTYFQAADPRVFDVILQLRKLEVVTFHDSYPLPDAFVHKLKTLPALHALRLVRCRVLTDYGLAGLGRLRNLRTLSLSGCSNLHLGGLVAHPSLETLEIAGCTNIDFNGIDNLSTIPTLRRLRLRGPLPIAYAHAKAALARNGGHVTWS